MLERSGAVGGACRTLAREGFHFDLTGHLLHLAREESHELLRALGVRGALRPHRRRAGIALAGTVTPYPIQINTYRLPREIRRECVLGFVEAHARATGRGEAPASFADWALDRFGEGFAQALLPPVQPQAVLHRSGRADHRVGGALRPAARSVADVIAGAFGLYRTPVGYNATFLYPQVGGIQVIADALAARSPRCGSAVRCARCASGRARSSWSRGRRSGGTPWWPRRRCRISRR